MNKEAIGKIKKAGVKTQRYFTRDLFYVDTQGMSKVKAVVFQPLKIISMSVQKFIRDQCPLRASALTFYSLLSIVPVAAMAFGIAKGFGLEKRLEQDLYLRFSGQQEVLNLIIGFARTLLENTKGGIVAGIGVLTLLLSVVKVLNHIESAFNLIWGVESRKFDRKFSDYLAIMLTGPLLFTMSSSLTVYIRTQVETVAANVAILDFISPLIFFGLKLMPYLLVWLLFTIVYLIMPNTRVPFGAAFWAGVVAGTLYQMTQTLYISFQIFVANYNAIYGSFAALPLFMVWLQTSWIILLFGAEISNAHWTAGGVGCFMTFDNISFFHKKMVTLQVLHCLVKRFERGDPPFTAADIALELNLPIRLVQELSSQLAETGLITLTQLPKRHAPGLQPGKDIHSLSIQSVIDELDHLGESTYTLSETPLQTRIMQKLKAFKQEAHRSQSNCLLKVIQDGP